MGRAFVEIAKTREVMLPVFFFLLFCIWERRVCLGKFPWYMYEGGRVVGSSATAIETPLSRLHLQLLTQIILNHLTTHLVDRLVTEFYADAKPARCKKRL